MDQPEHKAPEPFVGVKEIAETLGVHKETVRRWARKKGLPHRRPAGEYLFRWSEVEAWLDANPDREAA